MSNNTLGNSTIVARETLAVLKNLLGVAQNMNRDYEPEFKNALSKSYAAGQTIYIPKPPRYTWRAGRVAQPQATVFNQVPLTLSQGGVDVNFTSAERTLSITDDRAQAKIRAMAATIANEIDLQAAAIAYRSTFNSVGTPGSAPATAAAALGLITDAQAKLDLNAAPRDGQRNFASGPLMNGSLVTGLAGLFNNSSRLNSQYNRGVMVDSLGASFVMDQNIVTHTNGTQPVAALTVNGAGQTGAALVTAATTGTITRGTVFTIAGVFAVNPQNRMSTGQLQQFVVTADVGTGATAVPISPSITPTGNFQNVTASPANGALITIVGTVGGSYPVNVAFHRDAFTFAMVPLESEAGLGADIKQVTEEGWSIRYMRGRDIKTDEVIERMDVLFGIAPTYPELATRVLGV